MDILFHAQSISYLSEKRYDGLRQEQTGEITIPETLPELGRVADCFGAVLVQNRSTDNGSVTVSGGIQVGVLYVPANSEELERLELWLPFTVTKRSRCRRTPRYTIGAGSAPSTQDSSTAESC